MYNKFFGFKEKPFKLVPNPEYLFLSKSHEETLAHLSYAISQGEGFMEITGEVGTGKTTLCRVFLENLDKAVEAAYIFNPKLDALQLLKAINDEFGIDSTPDNTKDLIDRLNTFLIEKKKGGQKVLVLIDEAQNLSLEVLEQLRLLSNLETTQEKLLQIILVGQPELGDMLSSHQLRQLGQRITINCRLSPLSPGETEEYIRHRIALASHRAGPPFDKGSYRAIYDYSQGIPRLINIACDRALLNAFSHNSFKVTGQITREALNELSRKKSDPSYNTFRKHSGLVIGVVSCIALLALFLYLNKAQSPQPPAVSSPSSEPAMQAGARQSKGPKGELSPASSVPDIPEMPVAPGKETEQPAIPGEHISKDQTQEIAAAEKPPLDQGLLEIFPEKAKMPAESPAAGDSEERLEIAAENILHSVHVGVFPSASQAEERVAEMISLGFPSFMYTQESAAGNSIYVVVAGIYQSYDLAKEASTALSEAGYSYFIARAKDSHAARPIDTGQQQESTAAVDRPQQDESGNTQYFLNYLKGLNSRNSRNNSMEKILSLWFPAQETTVKQTRIYTDRVFFLEAAKQFGLQGQPIATESDLNLVQTLNLPAVFTFYLAGYSWPRYLAVASIDKEKIYFMADDQGQLVSVDRAEFLQYWSGEAYIFWKNFKALPGVISGRSSGQDIIKLKKLLQQLGYGSVSMTDRYDSGTMEIIKDIQAEHGLHIDGLVGPFTKIVLYNKSPEFVKPALVQFAAAKRENGS
ncbi:MAG: AAA family ATPase [Desulfobulbales bacterium]|nr:AAA family ATPase [Desulfobulbales bacterium]